MDSSTGGNSPATAPSVAQSPGLEATRERRLGCGLALLAAVAMAAAVTPELAVDCPDLNDSAYHIALAQRADEALGRGESPVDFWYPDVGLGFPLFHHYQHLPHLFLASLHRLLGGAVPIAMLYRVTLGTLLALFPLSVFWALRWLGLPHLTAGCAALVAPLASTPHLYGLGLESYMWGGSGLYAQLFASVLMPLALAESYRVVRDGRSPVPAALLIAATFLSQLVYGYMVALSSIAFVLSGGRRGRRALRLAVLLAVVFLIGAYFFVPALRDAEFANHSVWEKAEKWDSLGARTILHHLVTGALFDYGRWPVLTILVAAGFVYAVWRGKEPLRLIAAFFVVWLFLYFGRPTWGRLMDFLPLSGDIPLHRFIGAVHLFGLILAGCGLAWVARSIGLLRRWPRALAAGIVLVLLIAPAVRERARYLVRSRTWKSEAAAAVAADNDLKPLLAQLHALPAGRVYVGLPGRPQEYLRVGAIPLSAFCLLEGVDTLGFLWIAITFGSDVQVWFNPDDETHCRTFGVRYLVFDAHRSPPAFAQLIRAVGRYRIYEVAGVSYFGVAEVPFAIPCSKRTVYGLGHAWLRSPLPRWRVYPALAIAGRAPPDLRQVALDPGDPTHRLSSLARPSTLEPTSFRELTPWACEVEVPRAAAVVRRGSYHPGLRATVDGVARAVFPSVPGFAAVTVPVGRHEVRFWYSPGVPWLWLLIGAAALLSAGVVFRTTVSGGQFIGQTPRV